jgi:chorismate synthase
MLRFLTAGESHGPELTVILEGMPAGVPLSHEDIDADLARRQKSEGAGGRMAIERDQVRITGGVMAGMTTGSPISMTVQNRDFKSWKEKEITPMTVPRPGHVDLNAAVKYGYRDLRLGLERASARETTVRVAAGAVCKKLLSAFRVIVGSYVISIGEVEAEVPDGADHLSLFSKAENSSVRCPDEDAAARMIEEIKKAAAEGDTLGGVFQCVALNAPVGLGSHVHWERRLSARLMYAVGAIPAIKGVEIGQAFANARAFGTNVHDEIVMDSAGILLGRKTNRAGGLEGGITTGEPILVRAAMKPISTTLKGLGSVDLASREIARTVYERSDICAVPRAAVVAEAMMAYVLADALLEKLGGDSLEEMMPRFRSLRTARLEDLPVNNTAWKFGYE